MQNRMKTHLLSETKITELFGRAEVGSIATINNEGYPYAVPVHFIYHENKIYVHGLPKGEKIENILKNEKVGFEVFDMQGFIMDETACDTNTKYESVVILGNAKLISSFDKKEEILNRIIDKYTPKHSGKKLPENMINGTAVIEINILKCTGKYYG